MKRVGIFGGGQLGAMLASAIADLGGRVSVYDPDPDAPALRRTDDSVCAPWSDARALERFVTGCDVITYEWENIDTSALRSLAGLRPIVPDLAILETTQDRIREKQLCRDVGLPHVDYRPVLLAAELSAAGDDLGFPLILKTARGGYDGKGQSFIRTPDELRTAAERYKEVRGGFVLEEAIELEMEVSCIVVRDAAGGEATFPICENLHRDHILDFTLLPARLSPEIAREVEAVALAAARAMRLVGLLTVEFFLGRSTRTGERRVFVNEFAPRPHNSGHITLAACTMSQFAALARVLLDVPLGVPRMTAPGGYCMGNLLGEVWLAQRRTDVDADLDLKAWAHHPEVLDVRIYGKGDARPKRKMGHYITHASTPDQALSAARRFRDDLMNGDGFNQ